MIDFQIETQPNDETCGPTCLHAIYRYYGLKISLKEVIETIERSLSGGTLSPLLGKHALLHGFDATIFVNNMDIFDPTWFKKSKASNEILITKLKHQGMFKKSKVFDQASKAFQEFLALGGTIRFKTIDVKLLKYYLKKDIPILTGLSATYLYRTARESFTSEGESYFDDINGSPCGHFVVLCGHTEKRRIVVADPFHANPFTNNNFYEVSCTRLVNSILLGVFTYDANLLIIEPKKNDEVKDAK